MIGKHFFGFTGRTSRSSGSTKVVGFGDQLYGSLQSWNTWVVIWRIFILNGSGEVPRSLQGIKTNKGHEFPNYGRW